MIYGVGIDLVRIERMKDVVDRWGKKFLQRVFTQGEISYCYEKRIPIFRYQFVLRQKRR